MGKSPRACRVAVFFLFFLSGSTGLMLQVLWMRELTLLFGSTAQAAGATLGAFFLGLAAGGAYWGRRSPGLVQPLRTYAFLEAGVALGALLFHKIEFSTDTDENSKQPMPPPPVSAELSKRVLLLMYIP